MKAALRPFIFPTLTDATWAEADLDRHSLIVPRPGGANPLLDPETCDAFVRSTAEGLGVDLTYGGYGEDRSNLWAGHYHKAGVVIHLGVDFNVPAGTPVIAPEGATVFRVARDPDQDGGWGGFVALALDEEWQGARFLIYGHLAHADLPKLGDRLRPGDRVGTVGQPGENGCWYPHLHVQCAQASSLELYGRELERMDGYGTVEDLVRHPDPTSMVCIAA
jgi:murein DD-endopeptidase MepM/ murein hydrolase activator NlpD